MELSEGYLIGMLFIALGSIVFLIGSFMSPRKVDMRAILNRNLLRWEGPAMIISGIGLAFVPLEISLWTSIIVCLSASIVGIWAGSREIAERKRRGEDLGDER